MFSSRLFKIFICLTVSVSLVVGLGLSASAIDLWNNQVPIISLFSNLYYTPVDGSMTLYNGNPDGSVSWGFSSTSGNSSTLPNGISVSELRWTVAGSYTLSGSYSFIARLGATGDDGVPRIDPHAFDWSFQYTSYDGTLVSVPLKLGPNVSSGDNLRYWLSGSIAVSNISPSAMDFAIVASAKDGSYTINRVGLKTSNLFFVSADFTFNPVTGDAAVDASINNAAQQIVDALDNLEVGGQDYTTSLNEIISLVRNIYNKTVSIEGEIDEVEEYLNTLSGYLITIMQDLSNNGFSITEWITTISVDLTSFLASFNAYRANMENFIGNYWDEFTEQREALEEFFNSFVNSEQYGNVQNQGGTIVEQQQQQDVVINNSYGDMGNYFNGITNNLIDDTFQSGITGIGQVVAGFFEAHSWALILFSWLAVMRIVRWLAGGEGSERILRGLRDK